MTAKWTKLSDGSWGVRAVGFDTGDAVTVKSRSGRTKDVVLGERVAGSVFREETFDDYDSYRSRGYCEDFPCCGHEAGDCFGQKYGSDASIKARVYARGYDDDHDYAMNY